MEERTALTEKGEAIKMWEFIKEHIRCNHSKGEPTDVQQLKYTYIVESDMLLEWKNACILCQKYANVCPRCPLRSCSIDYKTLWAAVMNTVYDTKTHTYTFPFTLEERLDACDKIIEAIKEDVRDNYKS